MSKPLPACEALLRQQLEALELHLLATQSALRRQIAELVELHARVAAIQRVATDTRSELDAQISLIQMLLRTWRRGPVREQRRNGRRTRAPRRRQETRV